MARPATGAPPRSPGPTWATWPRPCSRIPPRTQDAAYTLTGPEAISFEEAAERMTRALGRPFRYEAQTIAEAYETRRALTDEQWQLDAWVSTYTAIGDGGLDRVTDDVERLTGHPARTLEEALASA